MALADEMTTGERVRVYGLLAEAFCSAPTEESAHEVAQLAQDLGIPCPHGLPLGEIQREFMDVFVVPNPRYVAPYESVYRDQWLIPPASGTVDPQVVRGLLMADSTLAVQQSFMEAKYKIPSFFFRVVVSRNNFTTSTDEYVQKLINRDIERIFKQWERKKPIPEIAN